MSKLKMSVLIMRENMLFLEEFTPLTKLWQWQISPLNWEPSFTLRSCYYPSRLAKVLFHVTIDVTVFVSKGPRSHRHGLTGLPDNNGNFLMGSKVCCASVPSTCCGKTGKTEKGKWLFLWRICMVKKGQLFRGGIMSVIRCVIVSS